MSGDAALIDLTDIQQSLLRHQEDARRTREALREKERALATLLGNLDGMAYRCRDDATWTMEFVSEGCVRLTGYSPDDLCLNGRISYEELTHPDDRARVRQEIRKALAAGRRFMVEYRIVCADGSVKWVWEKGIGIFAPDGGLLALEGFVQDVTERRRAEEALRQAELRYRSIFENAVEGIFQTTSRGRYLAANPALARMYGYESPEELIAGLNDISRQLYVDPRRRKDFLREMRLHGRVVSFTSQIYRRDGSVIWISENARAVRDAAGRLMYFEGTVEDISESKRYQSELEYQANYDALTNLPNRSLLKDRLQNAIAAAARHRRGLVVAFLDVDHFKLVNDSMGHQAGDELLLTVAERLRGCLRKSDTVARHGGDEFVLLLSDGASESRAARAIERVVSALTQPMSLHGRELNLTCSVGVALYPRDGEDATTLMRNADVAMYRAKEKGRNMFQFYSPEMNESARRLLDTRSRLAKALERQEFELEYQPQLDLARGCIAGMEALLRWRTPDGVVAPGAFIDVAEETGLIVPIGEWVLREACAFNARLRACGLPPVRVAVNLSARQCREPALAATVLEALRSAGLPPSGLELEITENAIMEDRDRCAAVLCELERSGVALAIDDFGTGYSSLSYLKKFPVQRLKVDREFVRDIRAASDDSAIVRAVVSLGHSLGLRVVAEGVETEAQMSFVRACGCDEVQGYLIGRPMSAQRFEALLRAELPARVRVA
jgi:diguanylate cyclase (GGDEF)-like protein/PAS domain S-box-containing protein